MKRYIYLVLFSLFTTCLAYTQEISFAEKTHDFGEMDEEDGDVSYDFKFTNTGNQPLVIKQVITGCGCTSAKWSKKPYQPGAKGVIRVTYHPDGRKNKTFNQVAEVFTSLKEVTALTVSGKVNLMSHPYVNFYDPAGGEKKTPKAYTSKDDYELIMQRVREQLYAATDAATMDKNATSLLKQMTAEGKWPSIDYGCYFRTNWEPVDHLQRIKKIALAYTCPASGLYGNQVLFRAIDKGLRYWNDKDPVSYNWWYNQISAPKAMADILALMEAGETKLSQSVVKGLMEKMERSDPRKWTGANKMDIAIHHLIRGCVLKNDSIVTANAGEILEPVKITDGEGIRKDLSYQQHGPQLYIGGYGTVFVDNIARMGGLFADTKYAMTDEQLSLFSRFVRETYLNVFRGCYLDFSVTGRGVSRANVLDYSKSTDFLEKIKELDPAHAVDYDAALARFTSGKGDKERAARNAMYYCSDYMLHNRKSYDFSVRASSVRTSKTESGNGENLYGTYMSDGATSIRVDGNEYLNIFPVWEWDKIPGTTVPAGEKPNKADWGKPGKATFTGGVSDGKYGVMAYDMDDYDTKTKKAWFFFDNEIVCLGAGIRSSANEEITTSVNQCHLVGDVYASAGNQVTKLSRGSHQVDGKTDWLWHNKVAYIFPQTNNLRLKNDIQKGSWAKINFNESDKEQALPIFNLWITHGSKPQSATYSYIIVPGIASPQAMASYAREEVKIESNTEAIQAVSCVRLDLLEIVFYQPGTLAYGDTQVEASKPCIVLVKGMSTASPEILVTDPTQKETLEAGKDIKIISTRE